MGGGEEREIRRWIELERQRERKREERDWFCLFFVVFALAQPRVRHFFGEGTVLRVLSCWVLSVAEMLFN